MKIAFLIPHIRIAGGVRVSLTYAAMLKKFGHEVTVIVFNQPLFHRVVFSAIRFAPRWIDTGIPFKYIARLTRSGISGYDAIVADSWQLAERLVEMAPHAHCWHLIQHDERLYHGDPDRVKKVYASGLKKITVSSWLQEMLKRDFQKGSFLLLNSFDKDLFYPAADTKKRAVDTFRILALNHPYRWKGTQEAIALVRLIQQRHPRVTLVGFGAHHTDLDAKFDENYFRLHHRALASLYSGVDLFLCASWDEGFGLPSLEAMACGTPVATYDNGGSRDFAKHEETALVAPHGNTDLLQKHVERMIIDEPLRTRLRENALKLAASWPTWEEQAKKFEKIVCQT